MCGRCWASCSILAPICSPSPLLAFFYLLKILTGTEIHSPFTLWISVVYKHSGRNTFNILKNKQLKLMFLSVLYKMLHMHEDSTFVPVFPVGHSARETWWAGGIWKSPSLAIVVSAICCIEQNNLRA